MGSDGISDRDFLGVLLMRFDGKVAVVTGAGDGIGMAIARTLASEGAKIVVADINPESGERAAEGIVSAGGSAISLPTDVADEAQVQHMVDAAVATLGRIDILVNNAGVVGHLKVVDMDREVWDRQIAVQLTGPFLASKHVARHMIQRGGGGRIVNISSVSAVMGRVKAAAHCASKGGLTMLTKVLAMELGEFQITVNAVAPGLIDVPSQRDEKNISSSYKKRYLEELPLGRMGQPDDIARSVLFLCSDDAAWITGQLYLVDGGLMSGHYSFQGNADFTMLKGHT
jgi:NAD(P)-dependent dehydrogenase (short-subunit alcohol dehydrogenase family)